MKKPAIGHARIALFATFAACATGASAQMAPGNQMPEALKGINQVKAACRANDAVVAPGPASAAEVEPDLACAIPAATAKSLLSNPNAMFADLRPGIEYQSFHIGNAMQLSAAELRSKPHWRGKPVLLIGNGKGEREVYGECARLKQLGYKDVRVLRGGMPQWLMAGQAVLGGPPSAQHLSRLNAAEFWAEAQNKDNFIILNKSQSALQSALPFSMVLTEVTGPAIVALLERRRKELKNAGLAALVVATNPAVTDEQLAQLQGAIAPVPLLVYGDTPDEFTRQVARQKAVWLAQARGPKTPACGQ